jgi:diphthine-ammonia ligase
MRVGVLFSGGKDSAYALYKALGTEEVVCLISVVSQNEESYMFHTPNIGMTGVQAEVMGIPLVQVTTEGEKEEELQDLRRAIIKAHNIYGIEGVVTGAVESVYQATRIQKICNDLDVWCFNPLWLKDQVTLLHEIIANNFKVIITGIFAYPLDEGWLGKEIDKGIVERLIVLKNKYKISPSGEGGEIETTVLDAPFFEKNIEVTDYEIKADKNSGVYIIKNVELVEK